MAKPKMVLKIRREMFAHWVQANNYKQTSLVFGCSANTVKNVVTDMPEYYARDREGMTESPYQGNIGWRFTYFKTPNRDQIARSLYLGKEYYQGG